MTGARLGRLTILHRLVGRAIGRDLRAFIVPGREIAWLEGLEVERAGLRLVDTPRHANVLLLVGKLPDGLARAAAVCFAQMPRPRAILALGTESTAYLPEADVTVPLEPDALPAAVVRLRRRLEANAFSSMAVDFVPGFLQTKVEYTCPMHPEVVQAEPGSCPICGMDLVQREVVKHGGRAVHAQPPSAHDHGEHMAHTQSSAHDNNEEPTQQVATGAVEYTCPMHPEIIQNEPGRCPICGMQLVRRDIAVEPEEAPRHEHEDMSHDHHEPHRTHKSSPGIDQGQHAPMAGGEAMSLEHQYGQNVEHNPELSGEHQGHGRVDAHLTEHDQPAHHDHTPESTQVHTDHAAHRATEHVTHPMTSPTNERMDHAAHGAGHTATDHVGQHRGMDHGDQGGGFMSMVAMTKDLSRSRDGLPMEWIEVPFGPLFPGLPGGLDLRLTLDGSTVAKASAGTGIVARGLEASASGPIPSFPGRLGELDRLAPDVYAELARRAVGMGGAGLESVVALERARAASHLAWLASFAYLLGDRWLEDAARRLQLAVHRAASSNALVALQPRAAQLEQRAKGRPLVRERLAGIGRLESNGHVGVSGPVARAAGLAEDARLHDPAYRQLDFSPVVRSSGDALARLMVRLGEITQSLDLIGKATVRRVDQAVNEATGAPGQATVETPRGRAMLHVTIDGNQVQQVHLETPSSTLVSLVPAAAEGAEVGDALIAIASLDLSPWEIDR